MNKYKVKVQLKHSLVGYEDCEVEVEAEDEEEAQDLAAEEAMEESNFSKYDADIEETEIEECEILSCEDAEKPRCENTPDMFGDNKK